MSERPIFLSLTKEYVCVCLCVCACVRACVCVCVLKSDPMIIYNHLIYAAGYFEVGFLGGNDYRTEIRNVLLNTDDTEMVLITLKHTQKPQTLPSSMQLNGYELPLFPSVRNLDVPLDRSPFPATRIPYTSGLLSQTPANQFYPSLSFSRCSQDSTVVLCCCFTFCLEMIIVIHSSLVALKI